MKTKVLMVCLGNICRSPLAEGILQSKVNPELIIVNSAGTAGYHVGKSPDPRSIEVAKINGIDISKQECRKFVYSDFLEYDYIYVMDKSNYANVINLATNKESINKVRLLLKNNKQVPDPYYNTISGFEHVFSLIDEACTSIATKLNKNT